MADTREGKRNKRKPNYSQEENLFIAEKYDEFKDVIDSKHKDVNTNRKKAYAWQTIYTQYQGRFPMNNRSLDDIKNKLTKLKSESKECVQQHKKSRYETGGGKPLPEPSPAQQKIIDLCQDTPAFQGLIGVESGDAITEYEVIKDDSNDADEATLTSDNEGAPSRSTCSTQKSAARNSTTPASKIPRKFDELVEIEKENLLIKRQNLLLKQEKLKLEIELLKRKAGNETVQNDDRVYYKL